MAAKKKSKFENKFRGTAASESRTANVRDERKVKDEQPKLSFNFKVTFPDFSRHFFTL